MKFTPEEIEIANNLISTIAKKYQIKIWNRISTGETHNEILSVGLVLTSTGENEFFRIEAMEHGKSTMYSLVSFKGSQIGPAPAYSTFFDSMSQGIGAMDALLDSVKAHGQLATEFAMLPMNNCSIISTSQTKNVSLNGGIFTADEMLTLQGIASMVSLKAQEISKLTGTSVYVDFMGNSEYMTNAGFLFRANWETEPIALGTLVKVSMKGESSYSIGGMDGKAVPGESREQPDLVTAMIRLEKYMTFAVTKLAESSKKKGILRRIFG